ncbi:MAG TPA: cupredoxin domain-containing protein [Actinomycetota bacterium]|nr:cupredoxin domain-containing protein [Actinomycetota bacterium]
MPLAAALALGLVACGSSRGGSGQIHEGPGGPDAVKVVMEDSRFEPDPLRLPAGTKVTVGLTNEGDENHNFTIDALHLPTGTMASGDGVSATFTVPTGSTEFHCTFHPGMDGTITGT